MAQGSCHVMGLEHDESLGEGVCVLGWGWEGGQMGGGGECRKATNANQIQII